MGPRIGTWNMGSGIRNLDSIFCFTPEYVHLSLLVSGVRKVSERRVGVTTISVSSFSDRVVQLSSFFFTEISITITGVEKTNSNELWGL